MWARSISIVIKQVFKEWLTGDPHPQSVGTWWQIYFIDFGIWGLEVGLRASANDILYSLPHKMLMVWPRPSCPLHNLIMVLIVQVLSQDVEQMLGRYCNSDLGSLSITDLLQDLMAIFQKICRKASSQITILEKGFASSEFSELAPNMDLMTLAKDAHFLENMGPDMLKQALNKEVSWLNSLSWFAMGRTFQIVSALGQILNGQLLVNP